MKINNEKGVVNGFIKAEEQANSKSESGKTGCSCLPLIIAAVLAVTILIPSAYAEKGVGIKWYTEAEIIDEQSTRCFEYGIYNPWNTDVNAILRGSDEFSGAMEKQESDAVFVKAGTASSVALSSQLCFTVGDIYDEECLIGDWFCERTCPKERVEYAGQVIVQEAPRELESGPVGSGATFGVAAPLRLIVECREQKRDLTPLYYAGGIVAGVVVIAAAKRRHNRGKRGRKRKPHIVIRI